MSRHLKRQRRTREEISSLQEALLNIVASEKPMTVRQVYYAGVVRNLYPKTELSYNLVCRELTKLRRDGRLPFDWLADNTRWVRKVDAFGSVDEVLDDAAYFYRKDLWRDNPTKVEIWLEKDALAGVVSDVTEQYTAPLYVTKGYASLSYLYSAAMALNHSPVPTLIYYFGDFDPSGVNIPIKVEETLREYAPDAEFKFIRAAVNFEQIESLGLPTRPTKRTDSRAKSFGNWSVELDAIPARTLRKMVDEVIRKELDPRRLELLRNAEAEEKALLLQISRLGQTSPPEGGYEY